MIESLMAYEGHCRKKEIQSWGWGWSTVPRKNNHKFDRYITWVFSRIVKS